MTDLAIRTEKLRKEYRTGFFRRLYVGLHGLDLEVQRGEVFGYIGPNGAGKTTTIKLLMGLNQPTSGRALLLGQPIGDRAVRARIGFLPERPYFYDHLTGQEFLAFYGRLCGLGGADLRARIDRMLTLVHMDRARDVQLRKFSKGMLQRIGVAQALINDPELVVLDEPSSGLDPMGRMLIRDIILSLKTRGTTVLFSSHVLADVEEVSDRVGIIAGGELRQVGAVRDLVETRVRAVEVALTGLDEAALAALPAPVSRVGARLQWSLPDLDAANHLIRGALAAGGTVLSVTPRRETLEQLFLDEVTAVERLAREAGAR